MLDAQTSTAQRALETGTTGGGGDRTLVIDAAAEAIVFDELERLNAGGARFRTVSEERGEVGFGASEPLVVIDPIDGSLNAKRGLAPYALSLAVAEGTTMAQVSFGYVYDFGGGEEWWAARDQGAYLNDARLDPALEERRAPDGRLELLGIESADPRWLVDSVDALATHAHRLRALGAMAPALCQVAAARLDALVSLRACRSVDAAAAQLIVREAGGLVSFPACAGPLAAPLDLVAHSPVVAARNPGTLTELELLCLPR
jgi:myo-inositol-1(or 4)-monophosphatase